MQILAFGDSITWGSYARIGWADQLRLFLWEREDSDDIYRRMYCLGIPGETTLGLLKRFQTEAQARIEQKYGKVILLFAYGSNDCAWIKDENKQAVPLTEYIANYEKIFDLATPWSPTIFLLTAPPLAKEGLSVSGKKERTNKDIDRYNTALKELSEKYNHHLVDINAAFRKQDWQKLFIEDGLHPNEAGHRLIFEKVKEELISYIQ